MVAFLMEFFSFLKNKKILYNIFLFGLTNFLRFDIIFTIVKNIF